jgi:hypothetical protein
MEVQMLYFLKKKKKRRWTKKVYQFHLVLLVLKCIECDSLHYLWYLVLNFE